MKSVLSAQDVIQVCSIFCQWQVSSDLIRLLENLMIVEDDQVRLHGLYVMQT